MVRRDTNDTWTVLAESVCFIDEESKQNTENLARRQKRRNKTYCNKIELIGNIEQLYNGQTFG